MSGPTGGGWQPDPTGRHQLRWHDGTTWTDQVADAGVAAVDPMPGPPVPPIDTVATGTPAGICTIESSESMPSRCFRGTGTPMTGSGVAEATIPGRCAAPPAPAITTRIPRPAAERA